MVLLPWLGASLALGHGGNPSADLILGEADGARLVATTHGLLFEDGGWDWVCEEVTAPDYRTDLARSADRWLLATTGGLLHSSDGCAWLSVSELEGELVSDVVADGLEVFVVTTGGLWRSEDGGVHFTFDSTPDKEASLRSFAQSRDGARYVLGFLDGAPLAWVQQDGVWGEGVALPAEGGRLELLGTDVLGRAYARFPEASGTDRLARIPLSGGAEVLLDTVTNISAFLAAPGVLYVSQVGTGTRASLDDGASWSTPAGPTLRCHVFRDGLRYACPDEGSGVVWMTAPLSGTDPAAWAWQDGLRFEEVTGPRCSSGLAAEQCADLWPVVGAELGAIEDTAEPMDADVDAGPSPGCVQGQGQGLLAVLLAALGLWRRAWPQRQASSAA